MQLIVYILFRNNCYVCIRREALGDAEAGRAILPLKVGGCLRMKSTGRDVLRRDRHS